MSQAALEAGFHTLLTSDQTAGSFYAAIGGRLHQGLAPEDAALPLATWFIVTDTPDSVFAQDDLEAEVQIDLWGEVRLGNYALSQTNDKLFTLIQDGAITISGFSGGHVRCIDRGSHSREESAYRILSRWQIRATKN